MGPQPTNLVGLVPILNILRQESVPEVEDKDPAWEMLTGKETILSGRYGTPKGWSSVGAAKYQALPNAGDLKPSGQFQTTINQVRSVKMALNCHQIMLYQYL